MCGDFHQRHSSFTVRPFFTFTHSPHSSLTLCASFNAEWLDSRQRLGVQQVCYESGSIRMDLAHSNLRYLFVSWWMEHRNNDVFYNADVFAVLPKFELRIAPNTAVAYLAAGPKKEDAAFTTPLAGGVSGTKRTGQCVQCRSSVTGDLSAGPFDCVSVGRRTQLFKDAAAHRTLFAGLEKALPKPLPRARDAEVLACDEWSDGKDKSGGYLMIRDPSDPSTLQQLLAYKYVCTGTTCTASSLEDNYDQTVTLVAEKTMECRFRLLLFRGSVFLIRSILFTVVTAIQRTAKKFDGCRPAPQRPHTPEPKFKANGGCFWCNPFTTEGKLTCGVNT
jgi:hypothetical protein